METQNLSPKKVNRKKTPKSLVLYRQNEYFKRHVEGQSIEQIAEEFNVRVTDVSKEINTAMDTMIKTLASQSPEQNYIKYAKFQLNLIEKLQNNYNRFTNDPDTTQYAAANGAIRNQAEIYEKILDRGIQFGVIQAKKASDSIRMSAKDLRFELKKEAIEIIKLIDEADVHAAISQSGGLAAARKNKPRKIKKVKRTAVGVLRATFDWKYREQLYDHDGKPIPDYKVTGDTNQFLPIIDPDLALKLELAKEKGIAPAKPSKGEEAILSTQPLNKPNPSSSKESINEDKPDWLIAPTRK